MAGKRRHFGGVRELPSGRWQARYPDPETGLLRPAPRTFERKREAQAWLANVEASQARGDWLDLDAGRINFRTFAETWMVERPFLSARTRERYEGVLRLYILPAFGNGALADIKEASIRRWRHSLLSAGVGEPTVAKSYRVLRAVLNTAVDDGLIRRNPCRVRGAGNDASPERPVLTIEEVYAVADAVPARYRAFVLLGTFASLRFGELAALRRRDIDLDAGILSVRRAQAELQDGSLITKDPKSEAGKRVVAIPAIIIPDLRRHLDEYAEPGPDGLVFLGPKGGRLRRTHFSNRIWTPARRQAGIGHDVRFHDLRHTGNNLAASTGASTRELMARTGHSSSRAALIYQHATHQRDRLIADAVSKQIDQACRKPRKKRRPDSGTGMARGGEGR